MSIVSLVIAPTLATLFHTHDEAAQHRVQKIEKQAVAANPATGAQGAIPLH
jgi:hypothetical protein